jgi:hypothetical protein
MTPDRRGLAIVFSKDPAKMQKSDCRTEQFPIVGGSVLYHSPSERNEKRNIAHRIPVKAQTRIGSVRLPQEPLIGRRGQERGMALRAWIMIPIFRNLWQPVAESAKIPRTQVY